MLFGFKTKLLNMVNSNVLQAFIKFQGSNAKKLKRNYLSKTFLFCKYPYIFPNSVF